MMHRLETWWRGLQVGLDLYFIAALLQNLLEPHKWHWNLLFLMCLGFFVVILLDDIKELIRLHKGRSWRSTSRQPD